MRSTKATRWLSGTLAALLLAQGMCLPAGAWSWGGWGSWGSSSQTSQVETQEAKAKVQLQSNTAIIPSTATDAEIKDILFEKLVVNKEGLDAQTLNWEFYGTSKSDPWSIWDESKWVDVLRGGTWKDRVIYTYTVKPLNEVSDGKYQVRLAGDTGDGVWLTKQAKGTSSITLNQGVSVALPYNESTQVDYDALRAAIFENVVASKTPEDLSVDDVTIEYYATAESGAVGDLGKAWMPLEGGKNTLTYPAISVGKQQIRISYDGTDVISGSSAETTVNIVDNRETPIITLNEGGKVGLHGGNDWDAVREDILKNVVAENSYGLTTTNTTIEYYNPGLTIGSTSLGAEWVPLEGKNLYPAVQDGQSYKVRITFNGSADYKKATSNEMNVLFASKEYSTINLNDGDYSANLSYNEALSVDYDALREEIYKAVVASTDPENLAWNSDNMTITYLATYKLIDTNSDTATNDILTKWVPLEGKEEALGYYPAISEGPQQIKISWGGNDDYYGFEKDVTVTITGREQAPYERKDPIGEVTLTVDESLNVNYTDLCKDIFNAVVASSDAIKAEDVTITYEAKLLTSVDAKYVPLEGEGLYPAISAGSQKIRIFWPGNQQYAPTTIEATVQVNDREQIQFTLNEGPYTVGMKFTDDQNYDYTATAEAIYGAVVATTTPDVNYDQVKVEYNADPTSITDTFKPLDYTDLGGLVKFKDGTWEIRISVADTQTYRGNSVIVNVTTTDNRLASAVALKSGASFTYNMDANAMKQAIFDNVIDWDNSTLPAKETLSLDDFVIEYKAKLTDAESGVDLGLEDLEDLFGKIPGMDDFLNNDILTQWVPLEGKVYSIGDTVLGKFPQIGAGENQSIRISYKGNADYRPSETAEGTVTVNKAKVSVKVNSTNIYADEQVPANFITTDPADEFDIYTIYAGVTSSVSTGVYLDLPDRYTADGSLLLKLIDQALEAAGQKTLSQMLNDGVTVGELRQLFSTQELLDLLDKLNIDTGTFGQILNVINKLPGVMDSVRIGFGTPNRAGLYTVTAITDNKNYETGVGFGFLLTKMRFSGPKLTWNDEILNGKLTAEQAKTFNFGATLWYNGEPVEDQSSVHYLYSGFTSSWRVYSSTTTAPTEPGRYVVTVCILGGNYMAAPITRSFQITK